MSLLRQTTCEPGLLEAVLSVNPFQGDPRDLRAVFSYWCAAIERARTMEDTLCFLLGGATSFSVAWKAGGTSRATVPWLQRAAGRWPDVADSPSGQQRVS
jgi:hypothetical protein